ncbi:MAG: NAD(P)H dehydrogenase (quinone) [Pseudomonadales bacterium]|nr:NAD(P)H dehydrogenase (quinone) [Pseudomonadales bacterium]
MKKLLIVYHSQSGSTERLARSAAAGAREEEEGVELRLLRAAEAGAADLAWCDALLLATPENFGYAAGALKEFLDRTFYTASAHELNRAYALIISAGNDGSGAVRQLTRIVRGYPLREVAEPLIVRGEPSAADLERARETGHALAAGLQLGIF